MQKIFLNVEIVFIELYGACLTRLALCELNLVVMKKSIITYLMFMVFMAPSCTSDVSLEDEIEESKDDKKYSTRKKRGGNTNSKVNEIKKDLSKKYSYDNKKDNSENIKSNEVILEIEYKIITNKKGEPYIEGNLLSSDGKFITLPVSILDKNGTTSDIVPYYKLKKELTKSKVESSRLQKDDISVSSAFRNIPIRNKNDSKKHKLGDNSSLSGNNNYNLNSDEYSCKGKQHKMSDESTMDIKSIILKLIKNFCYLKGINSDDKNISKNNKGNKPSMDGFITNILSANKDTKQDFENFPKNFTGDRSRNSKQSEIDSEVSTNIKNESDIIYHLSELLNNNLVSPQEISQPQYNSHTCKEIEERNPTQKTQYAQNKNLICDKPNFRYHNKKQYILPPFETITDGFVAQTPSTKKNKKTPFSTPTFPKKSTSIKNQEGIENNKMPDNFICNEDMPSLQRNYMLVSNNVADNTNNGTENSLAQGNKQYFENRTIKDGFVTQTPTTNKDVRVDLKTSYSKDSTFPYIDDGNACPLPFNNAENNTCINNNNKLYPQLSNYRIDPYNNNKWGNTNNIPYVYDNNENIRPLHSNVQQGLNNINVSKESKDSDMKSDSTTDSILEDDDLFSDIDDTYVPNNIENNNEEKKGMMSKFKEIFEKKKENIPNSDFLTMVEV